MPAGKIETHGNLVQVYDRYGELVGSQADGDLSGMRLEDVLDENDQEYLQEFRDILSQYINLDIAEVIESEDGGQEFFSRMAKLLPAFITRNCETMIIIALGY